MNKYHLLHVRACFDENELESKTYADLNQFLSIFGVESFKQLEVIVSEDDDVDGLDQTLELIKEGRYEGEWHKEELFFISKTGEVCVGMPSDFEYEHMMESVDMEGGQTPLNVHTAMDRGTGEFIRFVQLQGESYTQEWDESVDNISDFLGGSGTVADYGHILEVDLDCGDTIYIHPDSFLVWSVGGVFSGYLESKFYEKFEVVEV